MKVSHVKKSKGGGEETTVREQKSELKSCHDFVGQKGGSVKGIHNRPQEKRVPQPGKQWSPSRRRKVTAPATKKIWEKKEERKKSRHLMGDFDKTAVIIKKRRIT